MAIFLPFRISVCGLGELAGHSRSQVTDVVSILNPDVLPPADLAAFAPHHSLELRFHDIIDEQPGMRCPTHDDIAQLLRFVEQLADCASGDTHLLVHCEAGFSRSPACAFLALARFQPKFAIQELVNELLRIRPRMWPNLRMIESAMSCWSARATWSAPPANSTGGSCETIRRSIS